ncbi:TonB-dependent receptor plug domain-containing protein [Candidatus Omnitrophota bacterium]
MVLRKIFFALIFIFLLPVSSLAEEETVFDLGEIVISGDQEGLGVPYITEVTSQDIESKNAQTVDQALDFIPGVRVTVGPKNEPYVKIRGFNQDKVLILLDGIPIASPFFGYVDLDQIPVENVSKIKVIKNSISPLYGANTMGGVINIVTKKPGKSPHVELSGEFSDRDTEHYVLNTGARTENLSLYFSGSHRESDGFELSKEFEAMPNEDGGLRDNSFYEKDALSFKLGLDGLERHDPTVFFNYIDNKKGIPPDVSSTNPRYWRFTEWKRWMVALADEFNITESLSAKGRVYYDKYDNTINAYDDNTYTTQNAGSSWTSIYDEYAMGGSIYFGFTPGEVHSLKSSVNFKRDVHREQDDSDEPWETYSIHTYSFGLEDTIDINESLSFLVGMSYDLFDQIKTATNQKGSSVDSFNPMFSLEYLLNPEISIYSSVSKRTRFPTMNQVFSNTSGNPNLKEQENVNYEAGIRCDFRKKATLEWSYFYNDVKDLIDRASRNDQYLNISKSIFKGFETSIYTKIGEYLSGRLTHTYLDASDKDPSFLGRTEEELPYVPKHKLDIDFSCITDFGLSFDLLGAYTGRRHYYDSSNVQHELGGYFVWNTKLSQNFLKHWKGSISIENIFDRNYQEEEGYPLSGRTILFSVKTMF